MQLIYAFAEPLPLPRARGVQVLNTVAALAEAGAQVTLLHGPVWPANRVGSSSAALDPFIAAGMPLIIAILGVAVSIAGIFFVTAFVDLTSTTPMLALMLGLDRRCISSRRIRSASV